MRLLSMMSTGLGLSFVALILAQACPPHSTLKKGTCGVCNCIDRSKGKIVNPQPGCFVDDGRDELGSAYCIAGCYPGVDGTQGLTPPPVQPSGSVCPSGTSLYITRDYLIANNFQRRCACLELTATNNIEFPLNFGCSARYSLSTGGVETCNIECNPPVPQSDPVGVCPTGAALSLLRTPSGGTECACVSGSAKAPFSSGCAAGYSFGADACYGRC
ncbi:hypothetical protein RSOLAG1IB_02390 [Rhizoctonia solani AG-1 IB]|uniref:Uncharacterized protein n=1 Tax=Thanatephorus cucumeris (strain AG1-IB / isolate 7/3/14) TaxID=1108050 RepID=A0A0B7FNB8_THACB|nr:hypothetical protein RSOLAG1IB_02390 [Rhizoctonia solani AG-1 IB]